MHPCFAQITPEKKTVTINIEDVTDTVARYNPAEHKEISLDLLVGQNQKLIKKLGGGFVETPSPVIEIKETTKGHMYARVYVNNDYINIICHGINARNYKKYRAYKQFLVSDPGIHLDSLGYPYEFQLSNINPTILLDDQLNDEKTRFYQNGFLYCIADTAKRIIASLTVYFVFPKPELYQIHINKDLIKAMKDRPAESPIYINGLSERNNMELARENKAVNAGDTTDVPSHLILRPGIRTVLFMFKALNFRVGNYLEFRLGEGAWKTTESKEYPHILLEDLAPGKYTLQVRYPMQPAVFEYPFEIEPAFIQTTAFKVIAGVLLTAILGLLLFLIYSARQKRRLKEEVNKRTQLQHQITYLQNQLQPHFIFNALNSIQGLINKRNIEEANIYISKFGALLHEVIGKNDKTMQPLATELKQVEYYLQLEQLRFKFQYKIAVAANVNTTEINIPGMLLQPFVENAIKHGIVEKKEAGEIEVAINRSNNDLHIEIKDNGKGYDINSTSTGRGNTMVAERVQALNSLLKGQTITLTTRSIIQKGTSVSINFSNWF
jgi:two-component system LytT family sensor kinase